MAGTSSSLELRTQVKELYRSLTTAVEQFEKVLKKKLFDPGRQKAAFKAERKIKDTCHEIQNLLPRLHAAEPHDRHITEAISYLAELQRTEQYRSMARPFLHYISDILATAPPIQTAGQTDAANQERDQMAEIEDASNLEQLIAGKPVVTKQKAAEYLSLSSRQINNLINDGKLKQVGKGQQKKVTTASLRDYKGAPSAPDS